MASISRERRRLALASGVVASLIGAEGRTQAAYSHFGFCAAPLPPSCAGEAKPGVSLSAQCRNEVESYVSLVFKYRACLSAEMERAVREANAVIEAVRCVDNPSLCSASKDEPNAAGTRTRQPQ